MADDPIYPPIGARLLLDEESRDGNTVHVEGLRLYGQDIASGENVGVIDPANIIDVDHRALAVWQRTARAGDLAEVSGYSAVHTYAAGEQIGDPLPITAGTEALPTAIAASVCQIGVGDADKVLTDDAELWIAYDLGGGFGDAGDQGAVDFGAAPGGLLCDRLVCEQIDVHASMQILRFSHSAPMPLAAFPAAFVLVCGSTLGGPLSGSSGLFPMVWAIRYS